MEATFMQGEKLSPGALSTATITQPDSTTSAGPKDIHHHPIRSRPSSLKLYEGTVDGDGLDSSSFPTAATQLEENPGPTNLHHMNSNWQTELATSRLHRYTRSRASSMISCRTKLTAMTDEARSVVIEAGGRSFHISRGGSAVADITAPPPYPGPPLRELDTDTGDEDVHVNGSVSTLGHNTSFEPNAQQKSLPDLPCRGHRAVEVEAGEESPTTSRKTVAFDIPQRLRTVLSFWNGPVPSQPSDEPVTGSVTPLRRSQSDSSTFGNSRIFTSLNQEEGSASNVLEEVDRHPDLQAIRHRPDETAELRNNYMQLVRDLDRQQRQKLHERDEELAGLRILLDEKDKILRQQLREKDFTIETARAEMRVKDRAIEKLQRHNAELQNDLLLKIAKARHEVEDLWEARWKAFEQLLLDKFEPVDGSTATETPT